MRTGFSTAPGACPRSRKQPSTNRKFSAKKRTTQRIAGQWRAQRGEAGFQEEQRGDQENEAGEADAERGNQAKEREQKYQEANDSLFWIASI